MNKFIKFIAILIGFTVGYSFLKGACLTGGPYYAPPRELSVLIVTILTLLSSINITLKLFKFLT
ncbi:hypothetical protein [Pantoea sp. At-9b]|uniref:hypothetical protein n=1 Tax=Pantoea sp. (strain At-9b) TaxID=592316 RepID=UPI0001F25FDA|nr:hypothetical protein [Pantoea sp. At-9b]ADU71841.1 hypothetical protein Pat9b_5685 [Pantoea sp. At-9b]